MPSFLDFAIVVRLLMLPLRVFLCGLHPLPTCSTMRRLSPHQPDLSIPAHSNPTDVRHVLSGSPEPASIFFWGDFYSWRFVTKKNKTPLMFVFCWVCCLFLIPACHLFFLVTFIPGVPPPKNKNAMHWVFSVSWNVGSVYKFQHTQACKCVILCKLCHVILFCVNSAFR